MSSRVHFHLRRVGPPSTKPESADMMCFRKNVNIIGRSPQQVDFIICSSDKVQNSIISRRHSRIVKQSNDTFRVIDDSRNGIFVNDIKISGSMTLTEGDSVTFGHLMGEKLRPGTRTRQPDSVYQYVFETCDCTTPGLRNPLRDLNEQQAVGNAVTTTRPRIPIPSTDDQENGPMFTSPKVLTPKLQPCNSQSVAAGSESKAQPAVVDLPFLGDDIPASDCNIKAATVEASHLSSTDSFSASSDLRNEENVDNGSLTPTTPISSLEGMSKSRTERRRLSLCRRKEKITSPEKVRLSDVADESLDEMRNLLQQHEKDNSTRTEVASDDKTEEDKAEKCPAMNVDNEKVLVEGEAVISGNVSLVQSLPLKDHLTEPVTDDKCSTTTNSLQISDAQEHTQGSLIATESSSNKENSVVKPAVAQSAICIDGDSKMVKHVIDFNDSDAYAKSHKNISKTQFPLSKITIPFARLNEIAATNAGRPMIALEIQNVKEADKRLQKGQIIMKEEYISKEKLIKQFSSVVQIDKDSIIDMDCNNTSVDKDIQVTSIGPHKAGGIEEMLSKDGNAPIILSVDANVPVLGKGTEEIPTEDGDGSVKDEGIEIMLKFDDNTPVIDQGITTTMSIEDDDVSVLDGLIEAIPTEDDNVAILDGKTEGLPNEDDSAPVLHGMIEEMTTEDTSAPVLDGRIEEMTTEDTSAPVLDGRIEEMTTEDTSSPVLDGRIEEMTTDDTSAPVLDGRIEEDRPTEDDASDLDGRNKVTEGLPLDNDPTFDEGNKDEPEDDSDSLMSPVIQIISNLPNDAVDRKENSSDSAIVNELTNLRKMNTANIEIVPSETKTRQSLLCGYPVDEINFVQSNFILPLSLKCSMPSEVKLMVSDDSTRNSGFKDNSALDIDRVEAALEAVTDDLGKSEDPDSHIADTKCFVTNQIVPLVDLDMQVAEHNTDNLPEDGCDSVLSVESEFTNQPFSEHQSKNVPCNQNPFTKLPMGKNEGDNILIESHKMQLTENNGSMIANDHEDQMDNVRLQRSLAVELLSCNDLAENEDLAIKESGDPEQQEESAASTKCVLESVCATGEVLSSLAEEMVACSDPRDTDDGEVAKLGGLEPNIFVIDSEECEDITVTKFIPASVYECISDKVPINLAEELATTTAYTANVCHEDDHRTELSVIDSSFESEDFTVTKPIVLPLFNELNSGSLAEDIDACGSSVIDPLDEDPDSSIDDEDKLDDVRLAEKDANSVILERKTSNKVSYVEMTDETPYCTHTKNDADVLELENKSINAPARKHELVKVVEKPWSDGDQIMICEEECEVVPATMDSEEEYEADDYTVDVKHLTLQRNISSACGNVGSSFAAEMALMKGQDFSIDGVDCRPTKQSAPSLAKEPVQQIPGSLADELLVCNASASNKDVAMQVEKKEQGDLKGDLKQQEESTVSTKCVLESECATGEVLSNLAAEMAACSDPRNTVDGEVAKLGGLEPNIFVVESKECEDITVTKFIPASVYECISDKVPINLGEELATTTAYTANVCHEDDHRTELSVIDSSFESEDFTVTKPIVLPLFNELNSGSLAEDIDACGSSVIDPLDEDPDSSIDDEDKMDDVRLAEKDANSVILEKKTSNKVSYVEMTDGTPYCTHTKNDSDVLELENESINAPARKHELVTVVEEPCSDGDQICKEECEVVPATMDSEEEYEADDYTVDVKHLTLQRNISSACGNVGSSFAAEMALIKGQDSSIDGVGCRPTKQSAPPLTKEPVQHIPGSLADELLTCNASAANEDLAMQVEKKEQGDLEGDLKQQEESTVSTNCVLKSECATGELLSNLAAEMAACSDPRNTVDGEVAKPGGLEPNIFVVDSEECEDITVTKFIPASVYQCISDKVPINLAEELANTTPYIANVCHVDDHRTALSVIDSSFESEDFTDTKPIVLPLFDELNSGSLAEELEACGSSVINPLDEDPDSSIECEDTAISKQMVAQMVAASSENATASLAEEFYKSDKMDQPTESSSLVDDENALSPVFEIIDTYGENHLQENLHNCSTEVLVNVSQDVNDEALVSEIKFDETRQESGMASAGESDMCAAQNELKDDITGTEWQSIGTTCDKTMLCTAEPNSADLPVADVDGDKTKVDLPTEPTIDSVHESSVASLHTELPIIELAPEEAHIGDCLGKMVQNEEMTIESTEMSDHMDLPLETSSIIQKTTCCPETIADHDQYETARIPDQFETIIEQKPSETVLADEQIITTESSNQLFDAITDHNQPEATSELYQPDHIVELYYPQIIKDMTEHAQPEFIMNFEQSQTTAELAQFEVTTDHDKPKALAEQNQHDGIDATKCAQLETIAEPEDITEDDKSEIITEVNKSENITEDDNFKAIIEHDKSEAFTVHDKSEAITEDDNSEAITDDDKSEAITEDDKSEAITEDGNSEAITDDDKSEAITDDDKSEAITEDDKSEAITEDGKSEVIKDDDKFEAITVDGNLKAITVDDKFEAITVDDQSEAITEDDQSEAITEDDKSEAISEDDQSEAITEDDQSEAITEDDQSEAITEGDKSEAITEGDKSEAMTVDDKSEAITEDDKSEVIKDDDKFEAITVDGNLKAITVDDKFEAIIVDDQSEAITEDDQSEAITEDDKSEAITEDDQLEAITEDDQSEAITEADKSEAITEGDKSEAITEADNSEAITEGDKSEAMTVDDKSEAITEEDHSEDMTEHGNSEAITEDDQSEDITRHDTSEAITEDDDMSEHDKSEAITEQVQSESITEDDKFEAITEHDKSEAITANDQSEAIIEDDKFEANIEDDQSEAITEDKSEAIIEDYKSEGITEDYKSEGITEDYKSEGITEDDQSEAITEDDMSEHDKSAAIIEEDHSEYITEHDKSEAITEQDQSEAIIEDDHSEDITEHDKSEAITEQDQSESITEDNKFEAITEHDKSEAITANDQSESIIQDDKFEANIENDHSKDITEDDQYEAITEDYKSKGITEGDQSEAITEDDMSEHDKSEAIIEDEHSEYITEHDKSEAITEQVQSEAIIEDDHSENITENDQSEDITEHDQSKAIIEDDQSEDITEHDQSEALIEDGHSEDITEHDKSEAITEEDSSEAITEDYKSEAITEDYKSEAITEEDHSEDITELGNSEAITVDDQSEDITRHNQSEAITEHDQSKAIIEDDYSEDITEHDKSEAITEEDSSEAITEDDHSEAITEDYRSKAITEDDKSEVITADDKSEVITEHDKSEAITEDDKSEAISENDQNEAITGHDKFEAMTEDDKFEAITGHDKSEAMTEDDQFEAITVDNRSGAITEDDQFEAITEDDQFEAITENDKFEAITVDDQFEAITENEKFEAITEGDKSEAITEGDKSEAITEGDKSEAITEGDKSEAIKQDDQSEDITEDDHSKAITEGDKSEAINEDDKSAAITEDDESEDITEGDKSEAINEGDKSEAINEDDKSAAITEDDESEDITEGDKSEAINEGDKSETITEGDKSAAITEDDESEDITEGDKSEAITQGDKSEAITEGDKSETITEGDKSEAIKQDDQSEDITEDDHSKAVAEGDKSEAITQDDKFEAITMQEKSKDITDEDHSEDITEHDQSEGITEHDQSEGITEGGKSEAITEGDKSEAITEDNKSEGITEGGKSETITEDDKSETITEDSKSLESNRDYDQSKSIEEYDQAGAIAENKQLVAVIGQDVNDQPGPTTGKLCDPLTFNEIQNCGATVDSEHQFSDADSDDTSPSQVFSTSNIWRSPHAASKSLLESATQTLSASKSSKRKSSDIDNPNTASLKRRCGAPMAFPELNQEGECSMKRKCVDTDHVEPLKPLKRICAPCQDAHLPVEEDLCVPQIQVVSSEQIENKNNLEEELVNDEKTVALKDSSANEKQENDLNIEGVVSETQEYILSPLKQGNMFSVCVSQEPEGIPNGQIKDVPCVESADDSARLEGDQCSFHLYIEPTEDVTRLVAPMPTMSINHEDKYVADEDKMEKPVMDGAETSQDDLEKPSNDDTNAPVLSESEVTRSSGSFEGSSDTVEKSVKCCSKPDDAVIMHDEMMSTDAGSCGNITTSPGVEDTGMWLLRQSGLALDDLGVSADSSCNNASSLQLQSFVMSPMLPDGKISHVPLIDSDSDEDVTMRSIQITKSIVSKMDSCEKMEETFLEKNDCKIASQDIQIDQPNQNDFPTELMDDDSRRAEKIDAANETPDRADLDLLIECESPTEVSKDFPISDVKPQLQGGNTYGMQAADMCIEASGTALSAKQEKQFSLIAVEQTDKRIEGQVEDCDDKQEQLQENEEAEDDFSLYLAPTQSALSQLVADTNLPQGSQDSLDLFLAPTQQAQQIVTDQDDLEDGGQSSDDFLPSSAVDDLLADGNTSDQEDACEERKLFRSSSLEFDIDDVDKSSEMNETCTYASDDECKYATMDGEETPSCSFSSSVDDPTNIDDDDGNETCTYEEESVCDVSEPVDAICDEPTKLSKKFADMDDGSTKDCDNCKQVSHDTVEAEASATGGSGFSVKQSEPDIIEMEASTPWKSECTKKIEDYPPGAMNCSFCSDDDSFGGPDLESIMSEENPLPCMSANNIFDKKPQLSHLSSYSCKNEEDGTSSEDDFSPDVTTRSGGNKELNVCTDSQSLSQNDTTSDSLDAVLDRIRSRRASRKESQASACPSSTCQDSCDGARHSSDSPTSHFDVEHDVESENLLLTTTQTLNQSKTLLKEFENLLRSHAPVAGNTRVKSWVRELQSLKDKLMLPQTVIAVVGDTGSGKSSLLNALLDHAAILPTSGMRACTAVVVQIANNMNNDKYECDIDFLSEEEWMGELRLLLTTLTGRDGQVKSSQPDPDSEAGVAWSKIRAVYGPFKSGVTLKEITQKRKVTRWLGQTKLIGETNPKKFRALINRYIESTDTGSGGDYWPIVRSVRVRIPNCRVCKSGATLVDLPGIRDSNAARDKIAKDFLKCCTAVWVVSNINRAVDDKTAKNLLGEHFRRQLLMDGQYGSISFICTKTDILIPSEIIRALKMHEICGDDEHEVLALEEAVEALKAEQGILGEGCRECRDRLSQLQENSSEVMIDIQELNSAMTQVEPERGSDEAKEQLSLWSQQLSEMKSEEKATQQNLVQFKAKAKNNRNLILQYKTRIAEIRKGIMALCSKERNKYSHTQIERDFKAGLREMRRQAGLGEDDDDDGLDYSDEEDTRHCTDNLRVFCCSSVEYLKMQKKLPEDGPPQVFSSIEETGIPALQEFVDKLTQERLGEGRSRLVRAIGQLMADILGYLSDEGTKDDALRSGVRSTFNTALAHLKDTVLVQIVDDVDTLIDNVFSNRLQPKIAAGARLATQAALLTQAKWGSKVNKDNKSAGGICYATYKATVGRDGEFKSTASGPIDFNQDLAGPMYNSLTIVWDRIFNAELHEILDRTKLSILEVLKNFSQQMKDQLEELGVAVDRLNRLSHHLVTGATNKLGDTMQSLKEYITSQQREVSRVLTPGIQGQMLDGYKHCSAEKGSGCFNRMKDHMNSYVSTKQGSMFTDVSVVLIEELCKLQHQLVSKIKDACGYIVEDVRALYEPTWEAPDSASVLRRTFLQGMLGMADPLRELYSVSGLQQDLHELTVLKQAQSLMAPPQQSPSIRCEPSPSRPQIHKSSPTASYPEVAILFQQPSTIKIKKSSSTTVGVKSGNLKEQQKHSFTSYGPRATLRSQVSTGFADSQIPVFVPNMESEKVIHVRSTLRVADSQIPVFVPNMESENVIHVRSTLKGKRRPEENLQEGPLKKRILRSKTLNFRDIKVEPHCSRSPIKHNYGMIDLTLDSDTDDEDLPDILYSGKK